MTLASISPVTSPRLRLPIAESTWRAWQNRAIAFALLVPLVTVLGIAVWLTPHASGLGTHEELGLPPCGFLLATGYPCATCGMTTSFAYAAHGHLLTAFATQPAGTVLCILSTITVFICLYTLVTGVCLKPLGRLVVHRRFIACMMLLILASWAYTISIHLGHP